MPPGQRLPWNVSWSALIDVAFQPSSHRDNLFPFSYFRKHYSLKKKRKKKKMGSHWHFYHQFLQKLNLSTSLVSLSMFFSPGDVKAFLIASENNLKLKFFSRGSGVKLLDNSNLGFWSISPVLLRCPGDVKIRPRLNVDTQLSYIRLGIFSA